jgi:hypothetical protein
MNMPIALITGADWILIVVACLLVAVVFAQRWWPES